jgi:O-antigen ligase
LAVLEGGLLVAGLLLMSGAILPLLLGEPDPASSPEGYPSVRLTLLIFYGAVGVLIARRWRAVVTLASQDRLLWLLIAWVFLSAIWSDVPSLTGRRALALLLTTGVGLYVAIRFDLEGQARLVAVTLSAAALLSVLAVLLWPDVGIDQEFWRGPAWRGVYTQKNTLARLTTLLTASSLTLVLGMRPSSRRWIAIAALSAAFPFLTRSLTSLIAALAMYGVLGLLVLWHRRRGGRVERWQLRRLAVLAALTAVVWGSVLYLHRPPAGSGPGNTRSVEAPRSDQVALLDRRGTGLSRLELWGLVGDRILGRALLGYGYGAFWRGSHGASSYVWSRVDWQPPSAHNGFLDVALGIGGVGLLLMCAHLIKTGARAIGAFRVHGLEASGLWPTVFVVFFCLYNLPETSMLVQNSLLWATYVALAFSCTAARSGASAQAKDRRGVISFAPGGTGAQPRSEDHCPARPDDGPPSSGRVSKATRFSRPWQETRCTQDGR